MMPAITTRDELFARWPMLVGQDVSLPGGWVSLFDKTLGSIPSQVLAAMTFDQVKEKFGMLRVYYTINPTTLDDQDWNGHQRPSNDEINGLVHGVIAMAETISVTTCQSCGADGKLCTSERGWLRVSCDDCRKPVQSVDIYVDLDGVLADFELRLFELYGVRVHEIEDSELWGYVTEYDADNEWFFDLPMMADAQELWDYVKKYNPRILTATGRAGDRAADQKKRWVAKHLGIPAERVIAVRRSEVKGEYASPGAILIDDNLNRSIKAWTDNCGIGIHHVNARMTIAQLKALGL